MSLSGSGVEAVSVGGGPVGAGTGVGDGVAWRVTATSGGWGAGGAWTMSGRFGHPESATVPSMSTVAMSVPVRMGISSVP